MNSADIMVKMIHFSQGNRHDIEHFLKVYAYAKAIAAGESLSPFQQASLEAAAILHDIACPLCRSKYGHADGKHQELEGGPMAEAFLRETGLPEELRQRIVFLVSHHHTYRSYGLDHQILVEADYLVNAGESAYPPDKLNHPLQNRKRAGAAAIYIWPLISPKTHAKGTG